ncbi:hypothetical protein I317_06430 [Kwoniella heveanensis CBS 569]|nr:hypothetical protein I317_06430 [Kwoniella heveanensis CBS 569]
MPLESNADKAYMHDLPKVSFRVITDDPSVTAPAGVQSEQTRSYGYNDFSDFERPDYYIRYIEPIETELAVQVEYDMDEQDQEWLDVINMERKKDQSGAISYELFEIIMDKLEKEWFNLSKKIPQPVQHQTAEDSKCAVCDDGEGENSNAIVFCDGCNLAVHQDCYGVPYIPEGQWLCRKCTVSPEIPVSCIFCPNEGGAFKQTTTGHWAHLLCAIWIPETGLGNVIYMEPVEGIESIPKSRWKLVCSLCREKTGACIQCDNRNCFTAFHVTCARQVGLLTSMKSLNEEGVLKAYCSKHLPVRVCIIRPPRQLAYCLPFDQADSREDESDTASNFSSYDETPVTKTRRTSGPIIIPVTKKSAQAHSKSFRPGPPIVPKMIMNKLLDYVAKIAFRKKQPFIERLCRYWSLKREARRGAPLLKRLHLEPWTASTSSRQQTDVEKAQKLRFLQMLRNDLEKVRMLAELTRKREKEKLRQVQVIKDVVDNFIFPHHGKLRVALERISAMDRQELFLNPVSRIEVPDYFDVIKEPMCWLYIDEKLEKNAYLDVADFKRDILLVLDNAMLYNAKDSPFHRNAARVKKNAQPILDELVTIKGLSSTEVQGEEEDVQLVGDLEPVSLLLSALLHEVNGPNDPPRDILSSIFTFELEKPKEPTPPPAPRPPRAPRRSTGTGSKRLTWEEREAVAKERASQPGRSTRATKAMAKAFAQEAGLQASSDAERSGEQTPQVEHEPLDERSRRRSMRAALVEAGPSTRLAREVKPKQDPQVKPPTSTSEKASSEPDTSAPEAKSGSGSRSDSADKTSTSTLSRQRSQRGVVGLETIAVLTDRERRELEKGLDIMTEEVDAQDQFKRFNVGWVLPEGSKRRRSERPPDSACNPVKSRLPSAIKEEPDAFAASGSDLSSPPSSVLTSAVSTPQNEATDEKNEDEEMTPVPDDVADESRISAKEVTPIQVDQPSSSTKTKAKGKRQKQRAEKEGEQEEQAKEVEQAEAHGDAVEQDADRKQADEVDEGPYPPGTLVWAKVHSYPFFPAEIVDPTDEEDIPRDVFAHEAIERNLAASKGKAIWLVRFFDATNSYGWVIEDRLEALGDDEGECMIDHGLVSPEQEDSTWCQDGHETDL